MTRYIWIGLVVSALFAAGCSGGSADQLSKEETAKFNESIEAGKGELDLDKVPPEVREKVRGMMEAQKGPGGKGTPKAPGTK